eukprot:jgi/Galph1/4787/GphlegSOOS_G3456.1
MVTDFGDFTDSSVERTPFSNILKLLKKLNEQRKALLDERKKLDSQRWQLHAELKSVDCRLTELVQQRINLVENLEELSKKDELLQKNIEGLDLQLDAVFKEGKKFEDFVRKLNESEESKESKPTCDDSPVSVNNSTCLHSFCGHSGAVLSLDFQPEFNVLATGASDRRVLLWNFTTNKLVGLLYGHTGWVHSVVFVGNILATGSGDCTISLWDLSRLKSRCLENNEDLRNFSKTDIDWQSDIHRQRVVMKGHQAGVSTLFGDAELNTLFSGSLDKTISQWDLETAKQLTVMKGHEGALFTIQSWQYVVVSGSSDSMIRLWDIRSKGCQRIFKGHSSGIHALQFDETKLVSASTDHTVKLWDLRNGQYYEDLSLEGESRALYFDNDILLVSCDKFLYSYDIDTYQRQSRFIGHSASVRDLILVDMDHDDWKEVGLEERYSARTSSLCSYTQSKVAVSCALDGTVKVWPV